MDTTYVAQARCNAYANTPNPHSRVVVRFTKEFSLVLEHDKDYVECAIPINVINNSQFKSCHSKFQFYSVDEVTLYPTVLNVDNKHVNVGYFFPPVSYNWSKNYPIEISQHSLELDPTVQSSVEIPLYDIPNWQYNKTWVDLFSYLSPEDDQVVLCPKLPFDTNWITPKNGKPKNVGSIIFYLKNNPKNLGIDDINVDFIVNFHISCYLYKDVNITSINNIL